MNVLLLLSQGSWRTIELGLDHQRERGRTYTLVDSYGNPLGVYRRAQSWAYARYTGSGWEFGEISLPQGWAWLAGEGDTLWMVGGDVSRLKAYWGWGADWDSSEVPLISDGPKKALLNKDTLMVVIASSDSQRVYIYKYVPVNASWQVVEIAGPPGPYASLDADLDGPQLRMAIFSEQGLYWWNGNWELVDSAGPSPDYDGQCVRLSALGGTIFLEYSADISGKNLVLGYWDGSWRLDTVGPMCLSCWFWSVLNHSRGLEDLTSTTDTLLNCHRDSWGSPGNCVGVGAFDQAPVNLAADDSGRLYVFAFTLGDTFRLYTTREDIQGVGEVHSGSGQGTRVWFDPGRKVLFVNASRREVLRLWNASGRLLWEKEVQGNKRVNLRALKPGVYFATLGKLRLKLVMG